MKSTSVLFNALPALFAVSAVHAVEPAADPGAIVVTATRQATRINEIIADVTVIERDAIEQAGPTTLPELLARQPGLHVVDNGGRGKAASVFLRGSGSGHTLLLVDGVPLGSATSGGPSLQNLPLSQIERIEILRGPASSLYGSDAIGGVIQVFTRKGARAPHVDAFVGIGSHRTGEAQAGISGAGGAWSYSLSAAREVTDGFSSAADPNRYRTAQFAAPNEDADGYRNTAYSGRLSYAIAAGHEIGLHLLHADSRSAFDGGGPTIDAYNEDKTRAHGVYLRNRMTDRWTSTLRWNGSQDYSESYAPARSLFATRQTQWSWQNDLRLPVGKLLLALENLEQNVDSTTNYAINRRTVRSMVVGYQGNLDAHSWQTALRRDDNSQFGARTTGSLGYGYRFNAEWQARIARNNAFKAPSFNQLYFPGFGNANLNPETARNLEASLQWERTTQRAALTWFDNRIDNLIVNTLVGAAFLPINIGKARITGTSLSYGIVFGAWSGDIGLDLMRPVDAGNGNRLQRRPAEMFKLSTRYASDAWRVGAEFNAVGRRYDTATQNRAMGGYAVTNLFAAYTLAKDWSLEGRVNNLFDRVYENAWAYAVPGRELFVGLRYAPK